jgi:hypothetical protein
VALADAVVVAKVDESKQGVVYAFGVLKIPGAKKMPHQVAELNVGSVVLGPKEWAKRREAHGLQPVGFTLQVGYIVTRGPNGEDLSRLRRFATVKLTAGQEGCFFLKKHPEESFYVLQNAYDVVDKAKAKNFDRDLALIKRCAGLLKDPKLGLQARDKEDRLLTAAMLISRYRTPQFIYTGPPRTVPIDAEESRRILTILQEGDWSQDPTTNQLSPLVLFLRLDLSEEDGWLAPKTAADYPGAAQKWLREHADKYRIRRYVAEN